MMCLLDCGMTMASLTKIQKRGVEGNLGRKILERACPAVAPMLTLMIRLSTGKRTRRWCNMDKLEQSEHQCVSVMDNFKVVHLQATTSWGCFLMEKLKVLWQKKRATSGPVSLMVYGMIYKIDANCLLSSGILGCRTNCLGFKLQILSSASKCTKTSRTSNKTTIVCKWSKEM